MRVKTKLQIILLVVLCLVYGIRYFSVTESESRETELSRHVGRGFFKILVAEEPKIKSEKYTFKIRVTEVCESADFKMCGTVSDPEYVSANIYGLALVDTLAKIGINESVDIGDMLYVSGNLGQIDRCLSGNSGCDDKKLSYANFLRKERIRFEIKKLVIHEMTQRHSFTLTRSLIDLRKRLENKIFSLLDSPLSDLASGLTISGKGTMTPELLEQFRKVGLIHIVVLSGSNVSIISVALFSVLKRFPPLAQSVFGLVLMTLFCLMTGASPSVVRSVLMSGVPVIVNTLIGIYENKIPEKNNEMSDGDIGPNSNSDLDPEPRGTSFLESNSSVMLLLITGLIMSIHNPLLPLYDMSFQLSFMATLGLMTLTGPIGNLIKFIPKKFMLREIISSSLATQILVFPLLLHISGDLSTVFIFSNILVLPIIPFTMLMVLLMLFASYITLPLAMLFKGVSSILLGEIIWVAEFFSSFTFSTIPLKIYSTVEMCTAYAYLLPAIFFLNYLSYRHEPRLNNTQIKDG